jgi:aspartate aminotransferase
MRKLSNAAHRLKGQAMFQILTKARELERNGKEIFHFELGDPDFDTPENIVNAACKALKEGDTHYAPSTGIAELKELAANVTRSSRGFLPSLDQLLVCSGANVMIYYSIACAVNPGEDVIVPDPGFVSYYSIIDYLGVNPIRVPLRESNEFRLDPDDVEKAITNKTRMIVVNSPSNPTGAVMTKEELTRVYEIAEKHDLFLLSDEIYARMIYQEKEKQYFSPGSLDSCKERTIIVNGFSKSYAMTGWRLGVATGPSQIIEKMGLLLETTSSCVSPFIQKAGIEALIGKQNKIYEMVEEFRKRRDVMINGLNSLPGISCFNPKGAFYAFPNIRDTGYSSQQFTELVLDKAGVAVTPGPIFGINGEGFVRLCYVNSVENIEKAIENIRKVLT